jgi:hypothetical protein
MPERINIKKLRAAGQIFGLGFIPSKKDYARVERIQRERKIAWISEGSLMRKKIKIPHI